MARYIDAEIAVEIINRYRNTTDENGKTVADAIIDILKVITPTADVQESSHWISVKKNLPQNGLARVLVLLKNEKITDGIGFPKIDTDRCIDGKWVRWSSYVTHWMPLPNTTHQIPKGEHE